MARIIKVEYGESKKYRVHGEIWEFNHVTPSCATIFQVSIRDTDPRHYQLLSVPASLIPGVSEYNYHSETSKIVAIWGEGLYFNQRGELVGIPHETNSSILEKLVVISQNQIVFSLDIFATLPLVVKYVDTFPDRTELSVLLSVHAFGPDRTILKCSIQLVYELYAF